ncbi:MAG: nucleoside triphosphate pyrophosphohydrolase, partial [Calditerricola sp.]|nr:nucleoside triphosphate pyrophosphohydrolase [Calditerricola sp.]
LLLQVMLHAQMAEEEGVFTVDDVIGGLVDKLIRRHPHVFGDRSAADAEEALANWEAMKQREAAAKGKAGASSLLDSVPHALPALLKAWKIQKKAASVGFDWTAIDDVFAKVEEEVREEREAAAQGPERAADEVGDLLFAVVNLARFLKVDPEEALARTCAKFARRFRYIEDRLRAEGRTFADATLAEMDRWWNEAKEKGI